MLSPEEQSAVDKAAEFVLAFKGKGLTSDETTDMTAKLPGVFMSSAAGTAAMLNAMKPRGVYARLNFPEPTRQRETA